MDLPAQLPSSSLRITMKVCQAETAEDSTDEMLAKMDNLGRLNEELNNYSSRIPAALSLYKQY